MDGLVIDAKHVGNALRFVNHECSTANLISQTVFRVEAGCASFYYHFFIAAQAIPAKTPLTWDYHMDGAIDRERGEEGSVRCLCRSRYCREWLR